MIYLIQILNMLNKKEIQLFIELFNDLSYEIEEMGYKGMEQDLISDMLRNHIGLDMECPKQLKMFTDYIMRHQGNLEQSVKGACLYAGIKFA